MPDFANKTKYGKIGIHASAVNAGGRIGYAEPNHARTYSSAYARTYAHARGRQRLHFRPLATPAVWLSQHTPVHVTIDGSLIQSSLSSLSLSLLSLLSLSLCSLSSLSLSLSLSLSPCAMQSLIFHYPLQPISRQCRNSQSNRIFSQIFHEVMLPFCTHSLLASFPPLIFDVHNAVTASPCYSCCAASCVPPHASHALCSRLILTQRIVTALPWVRGKRTTSAGNTVILSSLPFWLRLSSSSRSMPLTAFVASHCVHPSLNLILLVMLLSLFVVCCHLLLITSARPHPTVTQDSLGPQPEVQKVTRKREKNKLGFSKGWRSSTRSGKKGR